MKYYDRYTNVAFNNGEICDWVKIVISRTKNTTILQDVQEGYILQRKLYSQHVRKVIFTQSDDYVVKSEKLANIFNLDDGQIIVSADKNLGFCILDEKTYLDQYDRVNHEQHFGKNDLDKEWNIANIFVYSKTAKEHLPRELTSIIKHTDFNYPEPN